MHLNSFSFYGRYSEGTLSTLVKIAAVREDSGEITESGSQETRRVKVDHIPAKDLDYWVKF